MNSYVELYNMWRALNDHAFDLVRGLPLPTTTTKAVLTGSDVKTLATGHFPAVSKRRDAASPPADGGNFFVALATRVKDSSDGGSPRVSMPYLNTVLVELAPEASEVRIAWRHASGHEEDTHVVVYAGLTASKARRLRAALSAASSANERFGEIEALSGSVRLCTAAGKCTEISGLEVVAEAFDEEEDDDDGVSSVISYASSTSSMNSLRLRLAQSLGQDIQYTDDFEIDASDLLDTGLQY